MWQDQGSDWAVAGVVFVELPQCVYPNADHDPSTMVSKRQYVAVNTAMSFIVLMNEVLQRW